jgi:hypothetical protein
MDPDSPHTSSARQTIVITFLTSMAAAFFLLVLIVVTWGYLIFLVAIVGAMVVFGGLHYLMWGRLLVEQTAGESEEERLRQRALAEDRPELPDDRIRR